MDNPPQLPLARSTPLSTPYYQQDGITILLGDCREVCAGLEESSVDLIFTDPPYLKEFNWSWDFLGQIGSHLLKENRSLFTLLGIVNLERAILDLSGYPTLRYWWACAMAHHTHLALAGKRIRVRWKPSLWYVKGDHRRDLPWAQDFFLTSREKGLHPWQQPMDWVFYWAQHLSAHGETVLDPFLGSGTTLLAAKRLGRKCIGVDVDERCCEVAARRLDEDASLGIEAIAPIKDQGLFE